MLISSAIVFLVIMITKPDGTALGYCLFFPKIHVFCLLWIVNARLDLAKAAGGSSAYVCLDLDCACCELERSFVRS